MECLVPSTFNSLEGKCRQHFGTWGPRVTSSGRCGSFLIRSQNFLIIEFLKGIPSRTWYISENHLRSQTSTMGKNEEDEKRERIGLLGSSLSAGAVLGWTSAGVDRLQGFSYQTTGLLSVDVWSCYSWRCLSATIRRSAIIRPCCLPSRQPAWAPEYLLTEQGLWPTLQGCLLSCFSSLL